jgi:3-methyladenine DNA glycosylase/8-oxoguanine DNA glycosylase
MPISSAFVGLHDATQFLAGIVRRRSGIRLPQLVDPFEGLARAVLGQQVSVAGASTITDRLVQLFALRAPGPRNGSFLAFPRQPTLPTRVRIDCVPSASHARARDNGGRGTSDRRRRSRPRGASPRFGRRRPAALEQLPGIGPWTAAYVRMRALGDRDAFPGADLGVIKALAAAGVERRAIFEVAEAWRPWRGYATIHLWASLSK